MTANRTIRVLAMPTRRVGNLLCATLAHLPPTAASPGPPHFGRSSDSACLPQVRLDRKRQKSSIWAVPRQAAGTTPTFTKTCGAKGGAGGTFAQHSSKGDNTVPK